MSGRIDRRQAIRTLSASAVVPLFHGFHPAVPRQEGDWKARFFESAELETVTHIAERIIPETDTPGARGALVHQYIDFVLLQGEASTRDAFRSELRAFEDRCRSASGVSFAELEPARQDAMLKEAEATPFFREVKRLTIEGYYRSEVGMKQELGFEGNTFLSEFEGCTHPEHQSAEPSARAQGERSESRSESRGGGAPRHLSKLGD
jgi:hypothetical protein